MFKRIKILALPLLMVVIFAALPLAGCGSGTPGGGDLTQQELEQVMTGSLAAYNDASSYAFAFSMDMSIEAIGGSSPGTMDITMRGEGEADIDSNTMYMDLEMSLSQDFEGMEGSQDVSAEIYMLTDWMYMYLDVPDLGQQWVKTPVTDEVKESYNLNMVDQQLAPLESMGEVKFLRYESVDGSQCYVLDVTLDIDAMKDWFEAQQMAPEGDWETLMGDMFNELSYIVWVDVDTNLLKKMNMVMDVDMTAEMVGATEEDFDSMTMYAEVEMTMGDYNEPVTIDLPDEAQDAIDM